MGTHSVFGFEGRPVVAAHGVELGGGAQLAAANLVVDEGVAGLVWAGGRLSIHDNNTYSLLTVWSQSTRYTKYSLDVRLLTSLANACFSLAVNRQ